MTTPHRPLKRKKKKPDLLTQEEDLSEVGVVVIAAPDQAGLGGIEGGLVGSDQALFYDT